MLPRGVEPGTLLAGRYRVEQILHPPFRMAGDTVCAKAIDTVLARPVAVYAVADDDPRAAALLSAARRVAMIADVRFLHVLDALTTGGLACVITEWVAGSTLAELLAPGALDPELAAGIALDVAEAIAAAHALGVSHDQLSAYLVAITTEGVLKIGGQGIIAVLTGHTLEPGGLDRFGHDTRGLGGILYAGLTGRWPGAALPPLPAAPPAPDGAVLTPRQCLAGVPRALDAVADRIVSPRPRHGRPIRSAGAVVDALRAAVGESPPAASLSRLVAGAPRFGSAGGGAEPPPRRPRVARPRVQVLDRTATGAVARPRESGDRGAAPVDGVAAADPPGPARTARRGQPVVARLGPPVGADPEPTGGGANPELAVPGVPGVGAPTSGDLSRLRLAARSTADRSTADRAAPAAGPPAGRLASEAETWPAGGAAARADGADGNGPWPVVAAPGGPGPDRPDGPDGPDGAGEPPHGPLPGRGWRRMVGVAIAAVALLAVTLLSWELVHTPRHGPGGDAASLPAEPTAATSAAGPANSSPSPSPAARPSTGPEPAAAARVYRIVRAHDFDPPPGDGAENSGRVDRVFDGNPSTAWTTLHYYGSPALGLLKPGVGVWVDLGRAEPVRRVVVDLTGSGTNVELRAAPADAAAPPATLAGWRAVSRVSDAQARATFDVAGPLQARYLLVWLTRLPPDQGAYQGGIREIDVFG